MDTTKELPTVIAFCAGYGGIERGLDLAGLEHRVIAYVEIEAFAIANLVSKMEAGLLPPAPIYTDIKTFPSHLFRGKVSILTGGYPCQPFSAAGKRLGEDDPRHLWPHIRKHIEAIRPIQCFFENVEGHISLDSPQLSATWKKTVTEQRGEYSQRVKLAHLTRESESISWPTPTTQDSDKANKQMRHNHQNGLTAVVFHREKIWPTPTAHLGQEGAYPAEYTRNTPTLTAVATQADGLTHSSGRLNPEWVEWLMGVPVGWTDLGCWVTE